MDSGSLKSAWALNVLSSYVDDLCCLERCYGVQLRLDISMLGDLPVKESLRSEPISMIFVKASYTFPATVIGCNG